MSPCAACKLLRRRCSKDCIFAPYFSADEPLKFAIVHKVFGASNISKMLKELPEQQRADAVSSMVYEANARVRDPVYGCVGAISCLQHQVSQLRTELAEANQEIQRLQSIVLGMREDSAVCMSFPQKQGTSIEYMYSVRSAPPSARNSNEFHQYFL